MVNNAASLVLARLEWQTPAMLQSQIQVGDPSIYNVQQQNKTEDCKFSKKKNTNYQVLAKVNLTGPALVTRQLLGQLRASRGSRVINLSSPCAHTRYCAV